jgi:hypothetical protein
MLFATRSGRRPATILTSIGLAALVATGSVLAGTPVTVGYRDHAYGGGAARPSSDKPQSKLWFTDGTWYAGMFLHQTSPTVRDENRIWALTADKTGWTVKTTVVDARDTSHADYLWDEVSQTLYVISSVPVPATVPTVPLTTGDDIRVFKYSYNAGTNVYTKVAGFPHAIPNTISVPNVSKGGAQTVTIALDSTGDLWAAWPHSGEVRYSRSEDGGVTWSIPAQLPAQVGNSIQDGPTADARDSVAVIAFGAGSPNKVGIMWSDQDDLPAAGDNGFYFAVLDAGADPTVGVNWTLQELPSLVGTNDKADNHINMKTTSDGSVYMVGKMGTDTIACATNKQRPLVPFFARTPAGSWSAHLAGTVGDCNTRPQLVISEELDVAYLFMTSPNGGGTIYRKSAPLSGPDAFDFRGAADLTIQRGTPFIKSATETLIDDPSTTKQVVTDASGIAVIANNLTSSGSSNVKVFLHNYMDISASDNTDPSGTVSINGGAATATNQVVSVAVPATDADSGLSLVRLSDSASVDGSGNLDGAGTTTFVYTTPIAWTLPGPDGPKTVYVQWRDAAGNWSAVSSDDITLNTTDPTAPTKPGVPSHAIFGSGRFGVPVRVTWAASTDNVGGSGLADYHLQYRIDGGLYQTVANPTTNGYSIDLSNSAHTYQFRVRARDNAGNFSPFSYGAVFKAISYSESSTAVKYSAPWALSTSPVYVGGKARVGLGAGRSATLAFSGNRLGWLSRLGPSYGSARVYIDGSLVKTINLNASTVTDRKLVFVRSWSAVGSHSIRIVVVGTSGHPGVVLDQIFVLR